MATVEFQLHTHLFPLIHTASPFLLYTYAATTTCESTCSGVWVRAQILVGTFLLNAVHIFLKIDVTGEIRYIFYIGKDILMYKMQNFNVLNVGY